MKLVLRCFQLTAFGVLALATVGCGGYGSSGVYVGVGVPGPYVGYPYYGPHGGWVGRPYPSPYWRDGDGSASEPFHDSSSRSDSTTRIEGEDS